MKIKQFLQKVFCKHDYHIESWHWVHGVNGNDPSLVLCRVKCNKCKKIIEFFVPRGSGLEECLICHKELYK